MPVKNPAAASGLALDGQAKKVYQSGNQKYYEALRQAKRSGLPSQDLIAFENAAHSISAQAQGHVHQVPTLQEQNFDTHYDRQNIQSQQR